MNAARLILALLLPVIGGCASHAPAPVENRGAAPAMATAATPVAAAAAAAEDRFALLLAATNSTAAAVTSQPATGAKNAAIAGTVSGRYEYEIDAS